MKPLLSSFLLLVALFVSRTITAQVVPFEDDVIEISAKLDSAGWKKGGIVFTGSSSVRLWGSLEESFPEAPILNTGFGGSKATDLSIHLFPLVLRFEPSKVFIYEGDNDINAGVEVAEIMTELDAIISRILKLNSKTEVFLISAKPSPSRWHLKTSYEALNQFMKEYAQANPGVVFIDVWSPMLDESGTPLSGIFLEDDLHMNEKGYAIWAEVFKPFIIE